MGAGAKPHPSFPGVFYVMLEDGSRKIATMNLSPGRTVYGERLVKVDNVEYRLWDPFRSKLAGAILKGLENQPIKPDCKVLYLGAASGTTPSHVSDIVGSGGYVYCVEFAPRSIRDLIDNVCRFRSNMAPILADARFPTNYASMVEAVDVVYCDIAQPEQAKILVDNARVFLRAGGWIIIAIKARSVDVAKEPAEVYKHEIEVIRKNGFEVHDVVHLEPYDKDHAMVTAKLGNLV